MSEMYTSSPEGEGAPIVLTAGADQRTSPFEVVPTTPDRRPSPVAPLPAAPSPSEGGDERSEATEDERSEATEDERSEATEATDDTEDDRTIVRQLFVGPSDNVPLLDEERLGLRRREVGCSATPTMGPARMDGEVSDLEDERSEATDEATDESDVGDVPNEATQFAELFFTDQVLTAMVGVPVWVLLTALIVVTGYLCILIGTGILTVRV